MAIGSGNGRLMSDINVTPFVDVMLVLLIIFMVTAPMMTEGVDVELPNAKTGPLPTDENEQLVISIDKEKNVYIDKDIVKLGLLQETLERRIASRKKRPVYLRADKDVPYGFVVRAMSEIKDSGVTNLGIVTEPVDIEMEKKKAGGNG